MHAILTENEELSDKDSASSPTQLSFKLIRGCKTGNRHSAPNQLRFPVSREDS